MYKIKILCDKKRWQGLQNISRWSRPPQVVWWHAHHESLGGKEQNEAVPHPMDQKISDPTSTQWKARHANLKIAAETGRENTSKLIPKKNFINTTQLEGNRGQDRAPRLQEKFWSQLQPYNIILTP